MKLNLNRDIVALSRLFAGVTLKASDPNTKVALAMLDYFVLDAPNDKGLFTRRKWRGPLTRAAAVTALCNLEPEISDVVWKAVAQSYNDWRAAVRERDLLYGAGNLTKQFSSIIKDTYPNGKSEAGENPDVGSDTAWIGMSGQAAVLLAKLITQAVILGGRATQQYSYERYIVEDTFELEVGSLTGLPFDRVIPDVVALVSKASEPIKGVSSTATTRVRVDAMVHTLLRGMVGIITRAQRDAEKVMTSIARIVTTKQHDLAQPIWNMWWNQGVGRLLNLATDPKITVPKKVAQELPSFTESRANKELEVFTAVTDMSTAYQTATFVSRTAYPGYILAQRTASAVQVDGARLIADTTLKYNWDDSEGTLALVTSAVYLRRQISDQDAKDGDNPLWAVTEGPDEEGIDVITQEIKAYVQLIKLLTNQMTMFFSTLRTSIKLTSHIHERSIRTLAAAVSQQVTMPLGELKTDAKHVEGATTTKDDNKEVVTELTFDWEYAFITARTMLPPKGVIPADKSAHVTKLASEVLASGVYAGTGRTKISGTSDLLAGAIPLPFGSRRAVLDTDPSKMSIAISLATIKTLNYVWPKIEITAGAARRIISDQEVSHPANESLARIIGRPRSTEEVLWWGGLSRRRFTEEMATVSATYELYAKLIEELKKENAPVPEDPDMKPWLEDVGTVQRTAALEAPSQLKALLTQWVSSWCRDESRLQMITESMMRAGIEWRHPDRHSFMVCHVKNAVKFMTEFLMPLFGVPDPIINLITTTMAETDSMESVVIDLFGGIEPNYIPLTEGAS